VDPRWPDSCREESAGRNPSDAVVDPGSRDSARSNDEEIGETIAVHVARGLDCVTDDVHDAAAELRQRRLARGGRPEEKGRSEGRVLDLDCHVVLMNERVLRRTQRTAHSPAEGLREGRNRLAPRTDCSV